MTLATGTRLGPYEILASIGAGGMGEVYRAKDPRLGREVAIKVLPASFSADPDRLRLVWETGLLSYPFGRGPVSSARFAPEGQMIVYTASWDGARKPEHQAHPANWRHRC